MKTLNEIARDLDAGANYAGMALRWHVPEWVNVQTGDRNFYLVESFQFCLFGVFK